MPLDAERQEGIPTQSAGTSFFLIHSRGALLVPRKEPHMHTRRLVMGALISHLFLAAALARAVPELPVLDDKPSPQLDAGGPSAVTNALAFSADGETLYAGGLDKVVRVWALQKGRYVLKTSFRAPVGPGNAGAVNAIALSPDGAWLAIAGRAPIRGEAGFRVGGVIVEAAALSREQNEDAGVIYVASTANPAGGKVLRGHRGEVRALAFAPGDKVNPPLLISAATERDGAKRFGGLRLWNVAAGTLLAERNDLPAKVTRPGLAGWRTGPGPNQVRVAVAWPEARPKTETPAERLKNPDYLYLWDPASADKPIRYWQADYFTQTAALIGHDAGAKVLTGGFAGAGRLVAWQFSADQDVRVDLAAGATIPVRATTHFLPVALALVSTRGDGAPTHAAVMLLPTGAGDFELALVDLAANKVVASMALAGSEKGQLPAIAARGPYLAVAATRDHAVRVYAVDDLLKGKLDPKDVLAGDGLAPRQVVFVDKGRGLWLREDTQAKPLSGGLLFDLDKARVQANDRDNLAADSPNLADWSFAIDADRKGVTVRLPKKAPTLVRLRGHDEVVTAAALRPATGQQAGVLAVAYTEREASRTLIMLCDPADGKPYRLLVNHLQDVRQLAFSASRQLLASVADDHTVCVWSLADLDRAIGQLPGLGVADGDQKKVVVRRIEPDSAAAKTNLAEGDVLATLAALDGKAQPVKDAAGFLLAISARRPGDEVEVTVAGKGGVKLKIERGVDERKPLFSLFLLRNGGQLDWVGWSPAGPYDYSSPKAEAHLGWHTNTGDPAAPVSYVAARDYQKDYYREGILRYLSEQADLSRALRKWDDDHPKPSAKPSLRPIRPDGLLATDRGDEYLTRQAVKFMNFGINDDYGLDDRHVLRWQVVRVDGGKLKADAVELSGSAPVIGKEWQVDLSGVEWKRGEYRLRVGLFARAEGPDLIWKTVTFQFQPPAPEVSLRREGTVLTTTQQKPLEMKEEELALQVALAAPSGQEVIVHYAQFRNGQRQKDALAEVVGADVGVLTRKFKLQEGLNQLTVRAVNKGALPGTEESLPAEVWVSCKAPQELPPRFSDVRLEPEPQLALVGGNEVWVVNRPGARLIGKIEAAGALVKAEWSAGGAPKSVLPPREASTVEFAADLELKAGAVVPVRLLAKSKHSDESVAERRIVFHPPLPTLTLDPLASPVVFAEKVTLKGAVQAATKGPFDLIFRVTSPEGKSASFKPKLDEKARTWQVELTLAPGANTVEAFVANEWRKAESVGGVLTLNFRRPPRITAIPAQVEAVETNKVRLMLTVESPADRPLKQLTVDGKAVEFKSGAPVTRDGRLIWNVELPEVFVNDGARDLDQISVRAVSDEGEGPAAVVRVDHKMAPRLPVARFLRPTGADTADRPEYSVTFRIESDKPLQRVEVLRDGKSLFKDDLKKVEKEGTRHVLQNDALILLNNGVNLLELVAVNSDGRSLREGAEAVVVYKEPAVLISIDQIEVRSDKNELAQVLKPVYRPGGDVTFPVAPRNPVLVGRVRWSKPDAKALDARGLEVVARVGDCLQFPVELGPRGKGDEANVRTFRAPLVLIGEENRVKIEVPNVGQQESSRRELTLMCAQPAKKQRLHLLIVGVEVNDAAELKKRVLDALAADPLRRPRGKQGEFFREPLFEECLLYHVLAGEVERDQVEARLVEIKKEITRLKAVTGWLNDVVLIYYQGEDVAIPGRKERWLKTSKNLRFPDVPAQAFAIPCHDLPRVPGAQLLLLNVAATSDAHLAGPDWGGRADTGFMRYACQGPGETTTANPTFLRLLRKAVDEKGSVGEIVDYLTEVINQQSTKFIPHVVLDKDQAKRRISEPIR
jgi:WD40 repeat protein